MDNQLRLSQFEKELYEKQVTKLTPNKYSLEKEKMSFINAMSYFLDPLSFDTLHVTGRPKTDFKDIVKSLLVMSFNGMSYRRTQSDLFYMYQKNIIAKITKRSTLNDYANDVDTKVLLERLIQVSATFFQENENTLILDSTWLATKMYVGGNKKVHDKENCNFKETRKLHIGCLKNSKAIAFAKPTAGEVHDSPVFEEIVRTVAKNGFNLSTVIADAGYSSKNSYLVCKELGILNAYINFRSNARTVRGKSDLWKDKVRMWRDNKEAWHEIYRFRAIVEGVFSSIKRKHVNYLRSRTDNARDVELLLKCLVHNLEIIGRYMPEGKGESWKDE